MQGVRTRLAGHDLLSNINIDDFGNLIGRFQERQSGNQSYLFLFQWVLAKGEFIEHGGTGNSLAKRSMQVPPITGPAHHRDHFRFLTLIMVEARNGSFDINSFWHLGSLLWS